MSKEKKIASFDPNSPGDPNANIFGLPFTPDEADVVIIPVPWDVTVSYSDGTSKGPDAIFDASFQVDLYEPMIDDAWKLGIAMLPIATDIKAKNTALRKDAKKYIRAFTNGKVNKDATSLLNKVNKGSEWLNSRVEKLCQEWINKGKLVMLLGGDHSTPYGMLKALASKYPSFGILQIDAHADLRKAYEGFNYSHASIMYNAIGIPQVSKLVQVGIRDFCEEEADLILFNKQKIKTYFDRDLKHEQYTGKTWGEQVDDIIAQLPQHVYLSFDIDGLDPKMCPGTGTPVAGGFEFEQAAYLIQKLAQSGKQIIACDLNEVAPCEDDGEWNANVGARMLLRMCNLMALSNGKF